MTRDCLARAEAGRFSVTLGHIPPGERDAEITALARALRREFPVFQVAESEVRGDNAVLVIASPPGTPAAALARLDGWGHGRLTLTCTHAKYYDGGGGVRSSHL